jgi:hypothetical protein
MTDASAKVGFMDLRIRVWMPMDPRDPCLAKIGDGPVLFQGKTPGAVRKAAEDWRRDEMARMSSKRPSAKRAAE